MSLKLLRHKLEQVLLHLLPLQLLQPLSWQLLPLKLPVLQLLLPHAKVKKEFYDFQTMFPNFFSCGKPKRWECATLYLCLTCKERILINKCPK
ncbi:hypothetical protein Bca4012_036576 [Brassica carinata]|uniref:Uncharacterized protein n=1 Tax=Brassica carinata TaxID=52824 RepID=A0A8X7WCE4_BRACI|nr:hypothetical protein Bca52824_010299 [Brassica carinata]